MSDLRAATPAPDGFRPVQALLSIGGSLFLNGLCPFLLYRFLEPHFPPGAVQPLLYATVFPISGLIVGIVRKRMVDTVALVVLLGMSINIAAIFLTPSIKWALVARSLNGLFIATILLFSALIGRPLFFYVARQFVSAGGAERLARFEAINRADAGRTFRAVTFTWALGIYALCGLNAMLALNLEPAQFLLVSQITTNAFIVLMVIWTIRFTRTRLR